jgi:uncharacterized protein
MTSSTSRCCDVYELARQGRLIEGELGVQELPRLAGYLADANARLRYRIEGRLDDRGRPCARLQVAGDLTLECQRCSAPLAFHLDRAGEFRFVATEEELNALPIEGDEDVEPIVGSHSMDIVAWVEDEAILSLPLVPRHDDCHARLPAEAADEAPARPNPFAVLADLKVGRKPH